MIYSGDEYFSAADEAREPVCTVCDCHLTMDEVIDGADICSECQDDVEYEDPYWARVDHDYHTRLDDSLTEEW